MPDLPPEAIETRLAALRRNCKHDNPSPSQDVGAWCNAGCSQFLPLRSFTGGKYRVSYYVDGRHALGTVDTGSGMRVESVSAALADALARADTAEAALAEATETAAWQFNEAVSMLREARLYVPDEVSLAPEIDEALPTIQAALEALARQGSMTRQGDGT